MSGGRNTKEFLVRAPSKEEAMTKLKAAAADYLEKREPGYFRWKVKAQALCDEITKEWRAYGRIEWK